MPDVITDSNPINLADFEGLTSSKPVRALIHTIRDYMPLFDQAVIQRGNDGMGDRGKIVTAYPEGQLRSFNEGWDAEKVLGADVRYKACMVRSRSEVDRDLYNTRPAAERDAWRLRQDEGYMRGLSRTMVRKMFYGDPAANSRDMLGLANVVTPGNDAFKGRIISAGGTTANKQASIWLVNWDPSDFYLFYPENGSDVGLSVENKGEQYAFDSDGKRFLALITEFGWNLGLAAYNPERVVRISNIDTTKLTSKGTSGANLIDLMTQALEMLPDEQSGRVAFYMNDGVRSVLRRQIVNKDNVLISQDEVAGRKVLTFGGHPVHKVGVDVLTNTEAVLATA